MSDAPLPTIAVVGRQNVGKSTLVNRLFGRRATIAHGMPGVTRDRLELEATWNGRRFGLVDTAGYVHGAEGIEAQATEQAERAIRQADLIVFVVDVRTGTTEEDGRLAARFRRSVTPVLLGRGAPLLPRRRTQPMRLLSATPSPAHTFVHLHYSLR